MDISRTRKRTHPIRPGTIITARAPVRVSFGGGGTDLPAYADVHGGYVVSAAITRYCTVTARPSADGGIRIYSFDYRLCQSYERFHIPVVEEPLSLPKAAIEYFAGYGLSEIGVDLHLASEVPPGTGLGSSSAMTVALVTALAAYLGLPSSAAAAAALASDLEIGRLGMPIGKQDQYASAYGGLNAIRFCPDGVEVRPLALGTENRSALASRLLLFSTGQSRHSSEILQTQREDSASRPAVIDSLHRLKSLAQEMCTVLEAGEFDRFGTLLDQAWHQKKQLSGRISSRDIDHWYDVAREAGALGGKITGAGGGGFLLLYCPPARQKSLRAAMATCGLSEMKFTYDRAGAVASRAGGQTAGRGADGSGITAERIRLNEPQQLAVTAAANARKEFDHAS
jgi:D-glycero-alpha-D-manno-heptose-7-phosphate kinase